MPRKVINMDFFQLSTDANRTVDQMLRAITAIPVAQRTCNPAGAGEPVSMTALEFENGLWQGTITKIRMSSLPVKASITGVVGDIDLQPDEGIGEQVSFVYDPTPHIRTMVLQRTLYGLKATGVCDYISMITTERDITPAPILNLDAMQRLANKRIIQKLEIKFAAPTNPDAYANGNESVAGMAALCREMEAGTINMTLTAERGRGGSLDYRRVRETIRALMTNPGEVSTLRLSGRDNEDSPNEPIDLLNDRMVEKTSPLNVDRDSPLRPIAMRAELMAAYARKRDQLNQIFRPNLR